jgi:hypothetical protein
MLELSAKGARRSIETLARRPDESAPFHSARDAAAFGDRSRVRTVPTWGAWRLAKAG